MTRLSAAPEPLEAVLEAEPSWPKTDKALAAVLNLILLAGITVAPALVWLVWRAVL
jgi:hypothetical protein